MRILAIAFVYNERDYLPDAIRYYREQGCELYVIDNYSDDGTWEWLREHGIASHRFDTQGTFHLEWLQAEMIKTIHAIKPDWFLWFAPDLYHVFRSGIVDTVSLVSGTIHNQIQSITYCFKNTGEKRRTGILFNDFHWAYVNRDVILFSKYHPALSITGDKISIPDARPILLGNIFEYGSCKPQHVLEEKLRRRQKAWKLGTAKTHGEHYLEGSRLGWVIPKTQLTNVWLQDEAAECLYLLNRFFNE